MRKFAGENAIVGVAFNKMQTDAQAKLEIHMVYVMEKDGHQVPFGEFRFGGISARTVEKLTELIESIEQDATEWHEVEPPIFEESEDSDADFLNETFSVGG